jgi:hypothetical protein
MFHLAALGTWYYQSLNEKIAGFKNLNTVSQNLVGGEPQLD